MSAKNAGNTNIDGYMQPRSSNMVGAHNPKGKPRVHLVSSKGKIPAEIVAHALAQRQAATRAVNPKGVTGQALQTGPNLKGAHQSMPSGVKPYPHKPMSGLT